MFFACILSVSSCILPVFFCFVLYFSVWSGHRSVNASCAFASMKLHARIAVASRSHCRGCIAVAESHRGRSASFAKCRRLDDFIGISSHSFSSGLWAERWWRDLSKARSNCYDSMHWRTAVHHPTRSIELKLCIAQCMLWPSINQNMMSTILLASQQYTWLKNSTNLNTKDPL